MSEERKKIANGLFGAAALSGLFGLLCLMAYGSPTIDPCDSPPGSVECVRPMETRLTYLAIGILLIVVAIVCGLVGLRWATTKSGTKRSRLNQYTAILTGIERLSIQQIATITNYKPSKVRVDVQSLIDSEEISDFYIDYQADEVVSRKYIPKSSHKTVVACGVCGARNDVIVGITRCCSHCGQALAFRSVPGSGSTVPAPSTLSATDRPAGWYPDPIGHQALRWWDGRAWSNHASPAGSEQK